MNVYKEKKQWSNHDINIPISKAVKRSASIANWYMCDPTQTLVGSCVDEDFSCTSFPFLAFYDLISIVFNCEEFDFNFKIFQWEPWTFNYNSSSPMSWLHGCLGVDLSHILTSIILRTVILHQHWLSITVNHSLMFHFNSNL